MPGEVKLVGRPASPGIAIGPIFRLDKVASLAPENLGQTGELAHEAVLLAQAVDAAKSTLLALVQRAPDPTSARQQLAVLEDETLASRVLDLMAEGASAEEAWRRGLEGLQSDVSEERVIEVYHRVLRHFSGERAARIPDGSIVIASDVTPTRFLETGWAEGGAVALSAGSSSSHVAMLARSQNVPMVVDLGWPDLEGHGEAIVDGGRGVLIASPTGQTRRTYARRQADQAEEWSATQRFVDKPAITADGTAIQVMATISISDELNIHNPDLCDGVGLVRSEFLFASDRDLLDEERQYVFYRRLVSWAGGRPVVVRTLDAGGDKPLIGLTTGSTLRGIQLSLSRPETLMVQLRALARASVHGPLSIMVPMVTSASELAQAATLLDRAVDDLARNGVAAERPSLGAMVEVPGIARQPGELSAADFLSIGSNDLAHLFFGVARDDPAAASLVKPADPEFLGLIGKVVEFGKRTGKPVSICGDMPSDPALIDGLLRAGLRTLSVELSAIGRVKARIAEIDLSRDPSDG